MVFFYGVYAINSKIFSSVGMANPISKVTRSLLKNSMYSLIFWSRYSGVSNVSKLNISTFKVPQKTFHRTVINTFWNAWHTMNQVIIVNHFLKCMRSILRATLMGSLELVSLPYDRYLKFMVLIMVTLLALAGLIIGLAPYLGLVQ